MELSPKLYHFFVRPQWYTRYYNKCTISKLFESYDFRNKKTLDFGCGIGTLSPFFDPGYYSGVDIDSRRIRYAKNLNPDYDFQAISEDELPFPNENLDFIMIMAVLHHIPNGIIRNYLHEFRRVLKPSGRIFVIEPCFHNKEYLSNWTMKFFDKGKYIRNENDYLTLFKESSFEAEKIKMFKKCFLYNELFFTARPQK